MSEEWRDIPSHPNYQASKDGRVRGKRRVIARKNGIPQTVPERIYKGCVTKHGYRVACIKVNGKDTRIFFHRLVAEAFCEKPEGKTIVNHKDGNKLNNSADNLEWCDYRHNLKHAFENGLRSQVKGEQVHLSKLTDDEVIKILRMSKNKFSATWLGKRFGVTKQCILDILKGRTWKHIERN